MVDRGPAAAGGAGIDLATHAERSSNFRKHTSPNPLQRMLIERFHRTIVERVATLAPSSVLDAGCGEGFVAAALLQRMPDLAVTGLDARADSVAVAAGRVPRARFLVGDVTDLPFPDEAFDVVGCFEVLEHLPGDGPEWALREFERVARRAIVVSVPHEPFFCLANAARGKNLRVRPPGSDPDHVNYWSRRAFGALVGRRFDVVWLGGSFPWTVCVATKRAGRS